MRKNEHPGCSCRMCSIGKHRENGHFTIKTVNKRLRQKYRIALKKGLEDQIVVSTPYTD